MVYRHSSKEAFPPDTALRKPFCKCMVVQPLELVSGAFRMALRWNTAVFLTFFIYWSGGLSEAASGIGVNWGTLASHRLPNKTIVEMLRANGFSRVKLFDADPGVVEAFRGTDIELMVAIPNEMLADMATLPTAAQEWVRQNVTPYVTSKNGVNIKYVAVGNEPFLKAYNGTYMKSAYPALKNVQDALASAGFGERIKATVPFNADVLSNGGSTLPSGAIFGPEVADEILKVLGALEKNEAPFTVNIYPFLSLQQDPNFPIEFAFFEGRAFPLVDGAFTYTNVFDASYDMLVAALTKAGYPNMTIIIGEIGWPTDGDKNANTANAQRFNQAFIRHVLKTGTPLRKAPLHVYLFSLLDEDQKTILPGNFERHWGLFAYDGKAKYKLDLRGNGNTSVSLVNAGSVKYLPKQWCVLNPAADPTRLGRNVDYACANSDCTSLVYGSSCNEIGGQGNASYAFNNYYQLNDQVDMSCYFDGLAMVTKTSPSLGTCQFKVQIATKPYSSSTPSASNTGASNSNETSTESDGTRAVWNRASVFATLVLYLFLL